MLFYTKAKVCEIVLCRSDVFLWKMTMQVIEERRLETGIFGMKRIRKDIQRTKEGAETPLASVLLLNSARLVLFRFSVFLFAVHAAVSLGLLICKVEDVRQLLFDGGDAARILAADHVGDLLRQVQSLFLNDLVVTDHVYGDVVINVTKYIKVDVVDRSLYFDDVLTTHFAAACIFDDGYLAVSKTVKTKVIVNVKTLACLNVIQNYAFL